MERTSAQEGKLLRPSKLNVTKKMEKLVPDPPNARSLIHNSISPQTPLTRSTIWTPPSTVNRKRPVELPEVLEPVQKKARGGRRTIDEASVTAKTINNCLNELSWSLRTRSLEDVIANNKLAITNPEIQGDRLFPKYMSFLLDFKFRFASLQACKDFLGACKDPRALQQQLSTTTGNNATTIGSQLAKLYHQLDQCDRSSFAAPIKRRLLLSEFLELKNKMYPVSKTTEKDKQGNNSNQQLGLETFEFGADIGAKLYPTLFPQQIITDSPARRRLLDVNSELMDIVFGRDSMAAKSNSKRKQLIQRLHLARPWLLLETEFGAGALALIPKGCGQQ